MLDETEDLRSAKEFVSIILDDPGFAGDHSRMPDHADPNERSIEAPNPVKSCARGSPAKPEVKKKAGVKPPKPKATVETE
ncbi:hypothetical protein [Rhizobium phaseoli]|uniref:hypothetical protein n=1 Tax=Rhizobium phaseoli TaxID=396 RepID=UPI0011AE5579|nr:hypothetical protein [Rhizobium phaseoli]